MSERTEAIYNSIRSNYGRMANGVRPWENNRDEFNDVLNYAPTQNQQTYDIGTDDAGNTILGNAFNNQDFSDQQQDGNTSVFGNIMDYLGSGSRPLVDDYDGEDVNRDDDMDTLIAGPTTGLDRAGQKAEDLWRAAQNTSLYASYMYSAADWADKGKWIFDKTGIDVNSLENKEVFEKAWKLANEVERQEKLATDPNGHVNMDKVYEAMPYLRDIHDAYGTAAAVQVMNAAPGLRTINDVYDSELARFGGSLSVGAQRGYYQLMNQVIGAKAMVRALANNKNLSPEEMQEVLRLNDALESLPDFSYSSPGALLGGLLGSAAEQAPIMLPEMLRTGAAITGKIPFAGTKAASAAIYAAMSTQIAGSQFINNATKTDSEGRPIYTPREAALLSLAQGLAEGYLEKQSIAAAGRAVFSRETAKKLADLYAKDAALTAGTAGGAMSATAREILRERIQHGFKAGFLAGAAELEEEFEQQVSDMVLENIAQVMTRGAKADVSSMEEILSESFGAAVEAIPAVAGFALMGAGGSVVADTRRVLDMRSRFEAAEANRLQRAVFENEHQKNIVFGVGQNLNNISDLEGKSPEVVTEILNSQNSKFGVEDSEVDIGVLMQQGHADIVDAIAKEAGKTPEDIQASMNGVQYLTVKTSALQKAISKMTPDQMKVLDPHITANGRMTDYRAVEFAKNAREALKSLQEKTDTERQEIVDRFVKETFPDSEETQNLARELITEDIDNPRAAVNRRIRSVQKSIDEFLDSTKATLKQGSGQGVDIVTNEDGTTGRASNNAEWYRNFYEDMGRAPTQAELEQIAYDNLTGTATRYAAFSYGELSPEDQAEISRMKGELDALFAERQNLRTVSDALRGFEKGDFLVTASMTPEAREVFNTVNNILGQHANEDVRSSARMSAVLAARQLSRLAEAWREAGRNVTALELLPLINVDGRNIVQDKSALSQAVVNQQMEEVRRQYEGTDQWMKAPNGQPTKLTEEQWLIVRTPAFKNWFGEWENDPENASKVVDENGEPLVVYHWTNNVFDTFRSGNMAKTIYFSESKKGARKAARGKRNVLECFLNVKNPVNEKTDPVHWYDAEESLNVYKWKKDGRDGVFVRDEAGTSIAVFGPTQIKSATDNNGQFSVDDPNIYHQFADVLNQSAWHGTGAMFEKFDLGYIGTGEGAQVHGYGIYFSGGRNVAEGYRDNITAVGKVTIDGKTYSYYTFPGSKNEAPMELDDDEYELWILLKGNNFDLEKSKEEAKRILQQGTDYDYIFDYLDGKNGHSVSVERGALYEVEIPENDVLLDEQKPLSEQTEKVQQGVRKTISDIVDRYYIEQTAVDFIEAVNHVVGQEVVTTDSSKDDIAQALYDGLMKVRLPMYNNVYRTLGTFGTSDKILSEMLNEHGVEGITYYGRQDGRCFVIFNDKAISIINRYNQEVNGIDRGAFSSAQRLISLFESADESTFMHEMAHFYLSELEQIANIAPNSQAARDIATIRAWAEWKPGDAKAFKDKKTASEFAEREKQILAAEASGNDAEARRLKRVWMQEKFARGFETYLASGKAPTSTLQRIFNRFKRWLKQIYGDVTGAGVMPSAEVATVMDRMIASDDEIDTMAIMRDASMISNVNPDLLDGDTANMLDRWKEKANEEAKGKLLKELLKEYREKDVDAHMKDFEEMEAERLQDIPAFRVQLLIQEANVPEADAAAVEGYSSVEAWKEDLAKNGGSYEAALKASMDAERDRYMREMPNDAHIMELAEEAMHSSDAEGRIAALESEILARRQKRYEKAPARLAKAMDEMESAIETAETEEPLEKALRTLEYSFRWQAEQKKQIEDMRETISAMKEEVRAGQEALQSEKKSREESESAIREQAQKDKAKLRDRMKEKLKKQVQQFKAATMQNAKWLRGVRDAALGMYKMNREMAQQDLAAMPAKDATNFRLWANQAKQAAQQAVKSLANAVRKQNGKKKEDTGERDYEAARQAKIKQSILDARAQEAIKLKRELKRIVDHLKRRSKTISKEKRGEIDASTRYYINHILYMLGINKSDAPKPKTLVPFNLLFANLKDKFDTENAANGSIGDLDMDFEVPQWLADIATAEKTPPEKYNEYTMPEIRDIRTLVDILYTTSRNKNRLLTTDKSLLDVLSDLIEDWQKTVTVEDGDTGISKPMALVLQPQVMLKTMGSTFKKYIYDTLADAWEQQTARQQEAAGYLNSLFEKYWPSKRERRKMRKDVLAVRAPDGTELTKENVLMIALNWGNEGNRLRVVNGFTHDGFVCTEGDVEGVLRQVMTKKDWEFVQEVWDYLNRLGDNVNEVVEKSTGAPMKRVEAFSFAIYSDTDDVSIQLRGGYYPIVYDPEKSVARAEQDLMTSGQAMGGASTFGTGLGSTKARSETGLLESPLLLSMDTLFKHVNQQIHISTMRLACRDAYKILTNSNVQGMMTRTLGIPAYRELKRWIENVWQEPISNRNAYTQFLERIRGKTVGAIMAYRTSVSLLNFANPVYMAREMGLFNAFCALSDFYLHPSLYAEKRRWVKENSPFMANRAHNIDRDLNQSKQNSFDPGNPISSMISDYANWLIEETDMLCSMPTYWWTYQQTMNAELEKGTDQDAAEKIAHRAAEDIVRKIFGSSDTVDQSSIQRSKDLIMKAITPFYTFTSTQANALWEQIYKGRYQGSDRTVLETGEIQARKKAFFRRYWGAANSALWTYMVGTLIEQMLRDFIDYLTGGDDKDKMDPTSEAFLRRWSSQSLTTFTSAVPVLNMFGEYLSTKILGQRYSGRNFGVIDASLNRFKDAFEYSSGFIQGKRDAIDAGRSVAKAIAGSGFGMPDTFTDAIFNAARAYVDHYSFDEWFWKSLFDRKLKKKGR